MSNITFRQENGCRWGYISLAHNNLSPLILSMHAICTNPRDILRATFISIFIAQKIIDIPSEGIRRLHCFTRIRISGWLAYLNRSPGDSNVKIYEVRLYSILFFHFLRKGWSVFKWATNNNAFYAKASMQFIFRNLVHERINVTGVVWGYFVMFICTFLA